MMCAQTTVTSVCERLGLTGGGIMYIWATGEQNKYWMIMDSQIQFNLWHFKTRFESFILISVCFVQSIFLCCKSFNVCKWAQVMMMEPSLISMCQIVGNCSHGVPFSSCLMVSSQAFASFSDLATYDTAKHMILRNTSLHDNYVTHTLARWG